MTSNHHNLFIISVFEHQRLSAQDFSYVSDFNWLIAQESSAFEVLRRRGQWQLKVSHYIGIIVLPSNSILEILPKTAANPSLKSGANLQHDEIIRTRHWVTRMLSELIKAQSASSLPTSRYLGQISNHLSSLPDQKPPLSQWLVEQFFNLLVVYEPNKQYQTVIENQTHLQGKLLIKEQLRYNAHQPHKFVNEVSYLNSDTLSNRLIKSAFQLIRPLMMASQLAKQSSLWHTIKGLGPYESRDITSIYNRAKQQLNRQPIDKRRLSAAQTLLDIAYWLLKTQQSSMPAGNGLSAQNCVHQTDNAKTDKSSLRLCLLINMHQAFEQWASLRIGAMFAERDGGYRALYQSQHSWLKDDLGQTQLSVRPDLLIYKTVTADKSDSLVTGTNTVDTKAERRLYSHVIDIKWKLLAHSKQVSSNDAYQLTSYAQAYQAKQLWLVYPTMNSKQLPIALHQHIDTHHISAHISHRQTTATLWLVPFNVTTGALNNWPLDTRTADGI